MYNESSNQLEKQFKINTIQFAKVKKKEKSFSSIETKENIIIKLLKVFSTSK